MHVLVKGFVCAALVSAATGLSFASPKAAEAKPSRFEKLVDDFFANAYFNFRPTEGTAVGFHQYDSQLEDYTKAGIDKNIAALRSYRGKMQAAKPEVQIVVLQVTVSPDGKGHVEGVKDKNGQVHNLTEFGPDTREALAAKEVQSWDRISKSGKPVNGKINVEVSFDSAVDQDLILHYIDGALLELESIRQWEKNPDRYSSNISNSAFVIMARKFAAPDVRLRSLIAREKQMPAVFDAARANLKNPPRVYTEVAISQLPGIISFFEKDVPLAFKEVADKNLIAEFGQSNARVVEALRAYHKWLKEDLLPQSNGDFRIGADNYSKKLLYDEMVDVPLDKLLEIGYANLHQNQQWFKETAAKLDPRKTPAQILDDIGHDHPAPDKLLQTFRDTLGGLEDFIEGHHIATIPSKVQPILEETPPFARALTFASMDTPGPYERVAKEAYFNVTLPEPNWTPQEVEEHMEGFNYGTVVSTAVHEAYPGHYVQFLWVPVAPSKTRKILGAGTDVEGWAHYCEQMMLDEGYGAEKGQDSPEFLKLRLGQLQDALLRNARYIVGIQMHTGKMTFDEGVDFFVKEGYQSRANGQRETKRGTSDPTYLMYTLGKLQIMKLREDYKKLKGDKFSLKEFHDTFLKQGFPPVKVIRRQMLGNDSPTL